MTTRRAASGRPTAARAVVALAAAAGAAAALTGSTTTAAAAGPQLPAGTAKVVRTDLSSTQQVSGSLSYLGSYPVSLPGGSSPASTSAAAATARSQAATARSQLGAAQQAVSDAEVLGSSQVLQAQAQVRADQGLLASDQTQVGADRGALSAAQAAENTECAGKSAATAACGADKQAVAANTNKVSADNAALARDQASLTVDTGKVGVASAQGRQAVGQARLQASQYSGQLAGAAGSLSSLNDDTIGGRTITALPPVGTIVRRGQPVYWLDGHAVPLLSGDQAAYRPFQPGMSEGPDVGELQQNLRALGIGAGVSPTGRFDAATAAAVGRLQGRLGGPVTGVFRLGQVVFLPGPARVTSLVAVAGGPAAPGSVVLTATSTTEVVIVPLPVAQEYLVHVGDRTTIDLPDGKTTTTGRISQISAVASGGPSASQAGAAGQAPASTGGGGQSSAAAQQQSANTTIPVTITLDDPKAVNGLDQAPVTVDITDASVHNALAVPVQALLALAGGGYGVQVLDPAGGSHLVPVGTGLFAGSLVQVTAPGLAAGTRVQVPAP